MGAFFIIKIKVGKIPSKKEGKIMIKVEEKACWIRELAWNPVYSNKHYNDVDAVFEFGDWILICSMTGGYLDKKSTLIGWSYYGRSFRIFSFLSELPDTKEEFDLLVEEIKSKGKKSSCRFPSRFANKYYYTFYHQQRLGADYAGFVKSFNFRKELSELEGFKIAIKKVYQKEFINEIIRTIKIISKTFLFFFIISTLGIFLGMGFDTYTDLISGVSLISLISFIFCIFVDLHEKKKGLKIFRKIDDLGMRFFELTDYEKSDLLYYNIVAFGKNDTLSVLNKIKKEIENLEGLNFIN